MGERNDPDEYYLDTNHRPKGSNADAWALFLAEHEGATAFLAVQIAEAIESAERYALDRAISRMGWPEIHAFQAELRKGQDYREDAGGYFMRAISSLFRLRPNRDEVTTHRDAARAMVAEASGSFREPA